MSSEITEAGAGLIPTALQRLRPLAAVRPPRSAPHRRIPGGRDVAAHYNLPNELFASFSDETMSYSSALFDTLPASHADLPSAQRRKIDRLLASAGVGPGSRVLQIGTAWGELCLRAVARGANVHSITLAAEPQKSARRPVAAAGLSDLVDAELRDYRDLDGGCDAVLSVEMIEAVGHRFWPTYFRTLDRLVRPGGRMVLQAVTMPHHRMLATRNTYTWVRQYIFPGGSLPSTEAIMGITERHTRLRTVDMCSLRPHYTETVRLWRERCAERRDTLAALGFDDVFHRKVAAVPGILSGRLRVRVFRCVPTDLRSHGNWPMNFSSPQPRWRFGRWYPASPFSAAAGSAACPSPRSHVTTGWVNGVLAHCFLSRYRPKREYGDDIDTGG